MQTYPNPKLLDLKHEIGGEFKNENELVYGLPEEPIFVKPHESGNFIIGSQFPLYDFSRGRTKQIPFIDEGADGRWCWIVVPRERVKDTILLATRCRQGGGETLEFAYESILRDHCAVNLSDIELGLRLYQAGGARAVEYPAGGRFIDILAIDAVGNPVVIEFKRADGHDRVLGQIQYYMGWITQRPLDGISSDAVVRGIIIVNRISEELRIAATQNQNLLLKEYRIKVEINTA